MTTIQTGFDDVLGAEMSYPEIDFEENGDDDDIDIDIDLETGHNDEDYMLDDVHSDAGNEGAVLGNDDVMIDDEHVSYPMDDIDIVQEEHADNLQMEDADLSDLPAPGSTNPEINTVDGEKAALFTTGLDGSSEAVMNEPDHREGPLRGPQVEDTLEDHTLSDGTEVSSKRREFADSKLSPPTSPVAHDHGALEGTDQQASSLRPDNNLSLNADTGNDGPIDTIIVSEGTIIAGQTEGEIDDKSGQGHSIIPAAERVLVVYRDAEYSLVSISETDDPDSFFFKDADLIQGSLADLLAGLREVIHDDLGPEDELCLAIEDLGIEISETCVSVHDLSFASVIDLYGKLLRNDGVETPGPLYVTLGTKPDFAKRLANLVTGAANGKGLSELITWDEESENFEDDQSGLAGQNRETEESDEGVEGLNESSDTYENGFAHETTVGERLHGSVDSEQSIASKVVNTEELEGHNGEHVPGDHSRPATLDNTYIQDSSQGQQGTYRHQSSDVDEDGDLIDYEEEENEQARNASASATNATQVANSGEQNGNSPDFIEPCLKSFRSACFCPACNERLLIYYEGKNNELRRRSLSLTAERDEPQVPPDSNTGNGPTIQDEQDSNGNTYHGTDDVDEYAGYQQYEEREEDQASIPEEKYEENIHDTDEFQVPYDGDTQQGDGEMGNVVSDTMALNAGDAFESEELDNQKEDGNIGDEDFDEIDYDTTAQDTTHSHLADHPVASSGGSAPSGDDHDTDEISYEEADILESNDSERTLIADEPTDDLGLDEPGQAHDEINYDTDDQQDLNRSSGRRTSIETSPTSNGHTGKRQRVDAEDVTDRAPKQSKRARS